MSKTSQDLQAEYESVLRGLGDLQKTEGLKHTDERWVNGIADMRRLEGEIEFAKEKEAVEKRRLEISVSQVPQPGATTNTRDMSYEGVYKRWLIRGKDERLPDDEMRVLETRGTNTNISSTNSLGGYAVPTSFSNEMEFYGIWAGGMFEACRVKEDPIGGTLNWPTGNDTSTTGLISGQGAARTVQDLTFGNVSFGDYTVDSGLIKLSRELLNDERVGLLQSSLAELIAERINRKTNAILTNGTGTSEPYGLTTAVTATGITSASATAIAQAELLKLMYKVDKYYSNGPKVGWMMHRSMVGYLRTLDFGTSTTHLFADIKAQGEPDMLLGYPIFINNDLPAANATTGLPVTAKKHIYFGDFSKYMIRRISGVSVERNDSVYWANFAVGFMGWTRLDGNLITQGAILPLLQA
jgi:HK97 family phage major capsid protein